MALGQCRSLGVTRHLYAFIESNLRIISPGSKEKHTMHIVCFEDPFMHRISFVQQKSRVARAEALFSYNKGSIALYESMFHAIQGPSITVHLTLRWIAYRLTGSVPEYCSAKICRLSDTVVFCVPAQSPSHCPTLKSGTAQGLQVDGLSTVRAPCPHISGHQREHCFAIVKLIPVNSPLALGVPSTNKQEST